MSGFFKCMIYLAGMSIGSFVFGRLLPKRWFRHDQFPFRSYAVEKEGNIYTMVGVRQWKDSALDMSAIFSAIMPSKKIPKGVTADHLERMIQETCVAEWVHGVLSIVGFGCVLIWKSVGGWVVSVLYALGNLPYIVIQRYNRPKLLRLWNKLREKEIRYMPEEQEKGYGESHYT